MPSDSDNDQPPVDPLSTWQLAVAALRGEARHALGWAEELWQARSHPAAPMKADLAQRCLKACHAVLSERERILIAAAALASRGVTPSLDEEDATWIDDLIDRAKALLVQLGGRRLPIRLARLNIGDAIRFVQVRADRSTGPGWDWPPVN